MSTAPVAGLPHEFRVAGSPVSVNRYGTASYRNWRSDVHAGSVAAGTWAGVLVASSCSVYVRYFQHLDRRKDVDNILEAILDGLDGKVGGAAAPRRRVLRDDRDFEHVVSRRTKIDFTTRLDGRRLRSEELLAALDALAAQAAVFVFVRPAPSHAHSVTR